MVVTMNLEGREKLAKIVRDLRGNESLATFAKRFSVSYMAVSKWENLQSFPDREHLAKIAKMSGYGLDDFVAFLEGKKPQAPSKLGHLKQQVKDLRMGELMEIYRAVGDRMAELSGIAEVAGSK
jgi:transcriptional regulator with XRE-family HTH domain